MSERFRVLSFYCFSCYDGTHTNRKHRFHRMGSKVPEIRSFVGGAWCEEMEEIFPLRDPADQHRLVAKAHHVSPKTAHEIMEAARAKWPEWAAADAAVRYKILERALNLLEEETESFVETITRENGKTHHEARMEVQAALSDGRYQLEVLFRFQPVRPIPVAAEEAECFLRYEPAGLFLLITPWNFPLATLVRKIVPALGFGNTVVCKPSEWTPCTAALWFEILHRAGSPPNVANLVLGRGGRIGARLVDFEDLAGISFTGSTEVGLSISKNVGNRPVRLQMEMGGSNALVILDDADLEEAVGATVTAAFSCAGQWCTSTGRVIVTRKVYEKYLDLLVERVKKIRVGPGEDPLTDMGPVISRKNRSECLAMIHRTLEEGAVLAAGGEVEPEISGREGWYLKPTVLRDVTPEMTIARTEVFGPVVAVIPVADREEALQVTNGTKYGLSFSVFTRSPNDADWFVERVEAGVCHVNLHTAFRQSEAPVGGWRVSGLGVPECGDIQEQFYTRIKTVYRKREG